MHHPVTTRPERTTAQIVHDQHAADRSFAYYDVVRSARSTAIRDIGRRIFFESQSGRLTACCAEGSRWARQYESNRANRGSQVRAAQRAQRAAEQAAATEVELNLDRKALRPYVSSGTKALMPKRRIHTMTARTARALRAEATSWWQYRGDRISWVRGNRLLKELDSNFPLWRLTHPQGGRTKPEEVELIRVAGSGASKAEAQQRRSYQYVHGQIRPAAMTLDKALEIAIATLA